MHNNDNNAADNLAAATTTFIARVSKSQSESLSVSVLIALMRTDEQGRERGGKQELEHWRVETRTINVIVLASVRPAVLFLC